MSKFKVGDKVRCVVADHDCGRAYNPGDTAVVTDPGYGQCFRTGSFLAYDDRWILVVEPAAPARPEPLEYLKARLTEVSSGELERMLRECFGLHKNVATKLIVSFEATAE